MEKATRDDRFASVLNDPRFRKVPLKEQKTKIDKRFQSMFKDKNFKLKYVMDKRGRPLEHTSSEDLKKYYQMSSEDDDEVTDKEETISKKALNDPSDSNDEKTSEIKSVQKKKVLKKHKKKLRRSPTAICSEDENEIGLEGNVDEKSEKDEDVGDNQSVADSSSEDDSSSESTSDDDSDLSGVDERGNDAGFDHDWEELDKDAPVANGISRRLALCNMDWDRIRVEDILAVFNSFKPADSVIHSVKIYPSEYGLKRMEEEKLKGPRELVEKTLVEGEQKNEDSRYNREKLREYQIKRLKYYYAVIDCDTPETANSLYEQLNKMEYESSAVHMDLRFIPDDVTFDQEPKSCVTAAPDPTEYKPRLFTTTALQQVKVNLTWDETDPKRRETLQRAFREPDSVGNDIRDYLASSSSDEDEGVDINEEIPKSLKMKERIANYKALLQSLEDKEKEEDEKYEMEITWEPGLKDRTEEIVKEKMQKKLTPFEEKVKKEKESRKLKKMDKKKQTQESDSEGDISSDDSDDITSSRRKHEKFKPKKAADEKDIKMAQELSLLMGDTAEQYVSSDQKSKKAKRKLKKMNKEPETKDDDFEVDIDDSRFSAVYTSHLYNIDPSDPHFKKTKGMQSIIDGKQKKRNDRYQEPSAKRNKMDFASSTWKNKYKYDK